MMPFKSRPAAMGFAVAVAAIVMTAVTLAMAPAHAQGSSRNPHLSDADVADLDRISRYLNDLTTMQGTFLQISDNGGMATGVFYMRRPGRLRFEYDDPVPIVFISDGTFVSIEDKELESVNSYPLRSTPLHLLLKKNVDLAEEADIVALDRREGRLIVTAREDEGLAQGDLTMIFTEPELELTQWVVLDAQGVETSIALRDVVYGEKINPALFRATDYDFYERD